MKGITWLSDAEWARIEPLLPRGRRGAHRVDDRRVISGIVHMLRSGARWRDCPAVYGPYTTIYNRFNRWSRQGLWFAIFEALTGHSGIYGLAAIDSTYIQGAPFRRRRKRGAFEQALGTSRGGRTSKLHAATDETGRPRLILLTAGNASDAATAPALLAALGPFRRLVADRGYDSNAIRQLIAERGAEAIIPPSSSRVRQIPYDPIAYRQRNLIERLWCRLKDWRRVATRYDKLARNYLASVYLAAVIIYWIN